MIKLKRLTVTAVAGLVAATGLCGFATLNGTSELSAAAAARSPDASVQDLITISNPTYVGAVSYNCMVGFELKQESEHADYLELKSSPSYNTYYRIEATYRQTVSYVVAPSKDKTTCSATYGYVSAYWKQENVYSMQLSLLVGKTGETKFPVTYVNRGETLTANKFSSNMAHGVSDDNSRVYFTIAYKGYVVDGRVNMPNPGECRDVYATVNGVTFTVRMDRDYIAILADRDVKFNGYDSMFAFYAEP